MEYTLAPPASKNKKCLLVIGGAGATVEYLRPLTDLLIPALPGYTLCNFSLSQEAKKGSLLDLQSEEVLDVVRQLAVKHNFSYYGVICTSMGAYAAVKLLISPLYGFLIRRAVFLDPADYYIGDIFPDTEGEITWAGENQYKPTKPVVSGLLTQLDSKAVVDVIRLSLRNRGPEGYLESDYVRRGIDDPGGFSRLNEQMVKSFYDHLPRRNRGEYLEVGNLPHGFLRDGDIPANINLVGETLSALLNPQVNLPGPPGILIE